MGVILDFTEYSNERQCDDIIDIVKITYNYYGFCTIVSMFYITVQVLIFLFPLYLM